MAKMRHPMTLQTSLRTTADRSASGLEIQHDFSPNMRVNAGAEWRSVETDSQDLGSGYDINFEAAYGWNIGYSRKRALEVAYVADVSNFDENGNFSATGTDVDDGDNGEIIDSDYQRHGAEVRWFGSYGSLAPYALIGGYYRVDESAFEYDLGAGLDFDMNSDTTVYLRGHYSSSGGSQKQRVMV